MANKLALALGSLTALAAASAPALAIPIADKGVLDVGEEFLDAGTFGHSGNLFGARFTIEVDVTVGSGFGLVIDAFGSHALGSDTELALYNTDGTFLFAINDDFDDVGDDSENRDAYLYFGDAAPAPDPADGDTNQGGFVSVHELLAGTYVMVIGPFETSWDELDVDDSDVLNFQGQNPWLCAARLFVIPAPASVAMLGLGGLALGGRRRRA